MDMKRLSLILVLILVFTLSLTGCGDSGNSRVQNGNGTQAANQDMQNSNTQSANLQNQAQSSGNANTNSSNVTELQVCFGDNGTPFIMHLYENDTAASIAHHVGTAAWRLPIYHYNDYDNWEVMQYYDIPSRYKIPSNPETVTSEKAGEVYYSAPNRIVLFFGDAHVSGEYTKVGYFDYTEEFKNAVENNPVLEGWGNKIVLINSVE